MPDNQIRAVIFDMDGTLLDTLADIAHSINSTLGRHGFPPHPVAAYRTMVGSGMRQSVLRALGLDDRAAVGAVPERAGGSARVSDDLVTRMVDEVNETYAADPVGRTGFYDGVPEMLNEISSRSVPMAVLSNKPDRLVQIIAGRFLDRWSFTEIRGQRDGFPKKPDPAAAHALAEGLGIEPANILFLGDSDIDILTARRAGMMAVGALWGFRDRAELVQAGADAVVSHPREVVDLLDDREAVTAGEEATWQQT